MQTTRALIRGIVIDNNAQIILVDTPGIFMPKRRLDRAMVSTAWSGAHDADLVCVLLDAREGIDEEAEAIFSQGWRPSIIPRSWSSTRSISSPRKSC